jgi:putative endonuclease
MSDGRDAQRIGQIWESRAAAYLAEQGLTIIARGYRCRLGELDIVGSDDRGLVIVEVRARRSDGHGSALESVNPAKRRKIIRATRHFLMCNPAWNTRPIRFDIVAFDAIDRALPKTTWVKNAFAAA